MSADNSPECARWSERKLVEAVDAQMVLAVAATSPGIRLGHYASASALLRVLRERAEREATAR